MAKTFSVDVDIEATDPPDGQVVSTSRRRYSVHADSTEHACMIIMDILDLTLPSNKVNGSPNE